MSKGFLLFYIINFTNNSLFKLNSTSIIKSLVNMIVLVYILI